MLKKILKGLVIGGAALTIAATPSFARVTEVNIYGASAQFNFWTAAAPLYLTSICADADVYAATNDTEAEAGTQNRDAGIAVCAGDEGYAGVTGGGYDGTATGGTATDTLIIRYTTNASYDGVLAVQNNDDFDPDNCPTDGDRYQAAPVAGELAHYLTPGDSIATLACMDVNVGASDVSAKTFKQTSDGFSKGPLGNATSIISRTISYPSTVAVDPEDAGYQVDRPIVVPFGFFANDDATTPVPVDNLSRMMAVNLFTGKIANWNELDPTYPDLPVVVCHRHAGSGTVATFNAAVLRGDASMPTVQKDGIIGSPYNDFLVNLGAIPAIFFNKGSSDATRCAGNSLGGVSYADSDKCVDGCIDSETGLGKYGDVKALAYQGVGGDANSDIMSDAIKYGRHLFWSAQWLYSNETGEVDAQIDALVDFAEVDANMPAKRADFWAAQGAMAWEKITDFSWPTAK